MNGYLIKLAVVGLVLFSATWFLDNYSNVDFIGLMAYGLLFFFFVFSLVAVWLSQNALRANNHRQFLNALTGSMVAKVLLTAFLVLIFGLVEKPKSVLVVIPMFVYYTVFTVLEVVEFLRLNKQATPQQKVG